MEYSILKAWVEENPKPKKALEKIELRASSIRLRIKASADLVVVNLGGESFAYWTDDSPSEPETGQLWPFMMHSKLTGIRIADADRIICIDWENDDIYGQITRYTMILELAGGHFNLILCEDRDGELIIRDALNKYSYADNPQRQVLPNLPYQAPETGFKPLANEPSLILRMPQSGEERHCTSANEYLHLYHTEVLRYKHLEAELKRLKAIWAKEAGKLKKKLGKQQEDMEEAEQAQTWFAYAEAIKYSLSRIKQGDSELSAVNYHDPELAEIEVPLLPEKSPLQNMDRYLKKYHKAKKGKQIIEENIAKTKAELALIEDVIARLGKGELVYPPGAGKSRDIGQNLSQAQKLLSLRISSDYEIVIGRKARENDFITTQLARPTDWWFHTRIYHGSHILLRCLTKKDPSPDLISLCASLAAWYSKAKFSSNVPVDYTQIRFVRKPRKSAPGFVTYTNHHTMYSEPMDLRAAREKLGL